jgi:hypothetical protein
MIDRDVSLHPSSSAASEATVIIRDHRASEDDEAEKLKSRKCFYW